MMYEELVKDLRENHDKYFARDMEAADAIEGLLAYSQNFEDALKDAVEELCERDWIPVTERLPDGDGKYLCTVRSFSQYNNKQYRFVDILVFQDGCFFECGIGMERVTHWMPLPKPPEEET